MTMEKVINTLVITEMIDDNKFQWVAYLPYEQKGRGLLQIHIRFFFLRKIL